LKLGNLLLDVNMNIKVAYFGLATLIENQGERKKTICGMPNYIAPEVFFDTVNGHSFEVDTWLSVASDSLLKGLLCPCFIKDSGKLTDIICFLYINNLAT